MEFFIDFLVNNYLWFLFITIILFFALVGYIVDSKEQKPATVFQSPLQMQQNLTNLAVSAQNKTIGDAVMPNSNMMNYQTQANMNPMNYQNNVNMQQSYSNTSNTSNFLGNQNLNYYSNNGYPNQNFQQTQSVNSNSMNQQSSFEVLGK